MWKLLLLVFGAVVVAQCAKTAETHTCACPDAAERFSRVVLSFAGKCLYDMVSSCKEQSTVGSPVITVFWLIYLAFYSYGKTNTELINFMNLKNKDEVTCVLNILYKYIVELPKDAEYYESLNIVADNSYRFSSDFQRGLNKYGPNKKALNFNFNNPVNVTKTTNNIITNDTHGQVLNTYKSCIINKSLQLNILDAISIRGAFAKLINFSNLSICEYYSKSNCSTMVPCIHHSELYNFTESNELDAKIVEIPLKRKEITILLFLPNEKCGLMKLAQKLQYPDLVLKALSSMKRARVNVQLPLYDNLKELVDIKYYLKKVAKLDILFDHSTAQFKNVIVNNKAISLSMDYQKIVVLNDVNNECEQSSNNKGHSENPDKEDEYDFKADHPIIVYVMYKGLNLITFIPKPVLLP